MLFVKPLHPCYNFALILHENAIFFSQAEVRKFFTYIFIKLKASAVIAASFSRIIKKKFNKGLQSEGSLIQASCLTSQARLTWYQSVFPPLSQKDVDYPCIPKVLGMKQFCVGCENICKWKCMCKQAFWLPHPGLPRLWLPEQFFCFYFKQDKGKRNIKQGWPTLCNYYT